MLRKCIRKAFLLGLTFFLFLSFPVGQFVNPNYNGTQASGFGEAGTLLVGPQGGILNPASLFLSRSRFGISLNTGVYSDYLLYWPTVKDLSINLPVIQNAAALRFYYGYQKDNALRKYGNYNFLGSYTNAYWGGRRDLGIAAMIRVPLNRMINKWNYLDLRVGLDISRFWGQLNHRSIDPVENSYWVADFNSEAGYAVKFGTLSLIRYSPRYYWILSSLFQGSISSTTGKGFDFYNLGLGIKWLLGSEKHRSLQIGVEIENITDSPTRKIGTGIKYDFDERTENSVQGGVFIHAKNYYHRLYRNRFLAWYSLGFTKSFHNIIVAFSLSDALNLNLSSLSPPSKDLAKVVSISLSVPIPVQKLVPNLPEIEIKPEFIDLTFHKRKLLIGKEDTLLLYVQAFGPDKLDHPKVFFNVEPKVGVVLLEPYVELTELAHQDFLELKIPVRTIPGIPAGRYTIAASLTYGNDNYLTKQIELETTEPALDVTANVTNRSRFWLFEIPGSYFLELSIENYGTSASETLRVIFPERFVQLGLLDKAEYVVTGIKPKTTRTLRIEFKAVSEDFPPKLPVSIIFKENNGFDPLPIHADFVIINRSLVSFSEIKKDPFLDGFSRFNEFYIVLNSEWSALKEIREKTTFILNEDPNFPGKIVIGPYNDLEQVLSLRYTVDNIDKNYELIALHNRRPIPLKRYFFIVEGSTESIQNLNNFPILSYCYDKIQPRKILIGPFQNLKAVLELEEFIGTFFPDYQIVSRYCNQVDTNREMNDNLPISASFDE